LLDRGIMVTFFIEVGNILKRAADRENREVLTGVNIVLIDVNVQRNTTVIEALQRVSQISRGHFFSFIKHFHKCTNKNSSDPTFYF
jgi:hypothetical protein